MRLCECGCGEAVRTAQFPSQQARFISGHNAKVGRPPEYIEEDRGYKTPCWVWQRFMSKYGYGIMFRSGKPIMAHRHYYERATGLMPSPNEHLHHLCKIRLCVNPSHLEPMVRIAHMRLEGRGRTWWKMWNDPDFEPRRR